MIETSEERLKKGTAPSLISHSESARNELLITELTTKQTIYIKSDNFNWNANPKEPRFTKHVRLP